MGDKARQVGGYKISPAALGKSAATGHNLGFKDCGVRVARLPKSAVMGHNPEYRVGYMGFGKVGKSEAMGWDPGLNGYVDWATSGPQTEYSFAQSGITNNDL